jgi:hypothetical protein
MTPKGKWTTSVACMQMPKRLNIFAQLILASIPWKELRRDTDKDASDPATARAATNLYDAQDA